MRAMILSLCAITCHKHRILFSHQVKIVWLTFVLVLDVVDRYAPGPPVDPAVRLRLSMRKVTTKKRESRDPLVLFEFAELDLMFAFSHAFWTRCND